MSTTAVRRRQVIQSLQDKEYRDLYVEEHISQDLAYQIQAMRMDRGWIQERLAELSGKKQPVIAQLENPDYGRYSIETLKRLASAFDVALVVRFVPFSQLVDYALDIQREDLIVPSFDKDEGLQARAAIRAITTSNTYASSDAPQKALPETVSSAFVDIAVSFKVA